MRDEGRPRSCCRLQLFETGFDLIGKVLLAAGLLVAGIAHADPLGECLEAPVDSRNATGCYNAELIRLDATLKEKYRKGLKAMLDDLTVKGASLEAIERATKNYSEAQRLWEKYRSVWCREYAGEIAAAAALPLESSRCQVRLTRNRVKDLTGEE